MTSEAVRYMGKLLLEGQSQWMIATALEAAGFDTPATHAYKNQGESGKIYEYYRCAKTAGKPACKGQSVKGERVTAAITALVERLAGLAMTVRRFISGEDHTEQLNHVTQAMKDLREEKRRNLFDYPGGDGEYSEALDVLVDERRRLAALPRRPSVWVEVETGQTFADAWAQADQEHRRQLLLGLKARLYMTPATEGWYLPAELESRVPKLDRAGSLA